MSSDAWLFWILAGATLAALAGMVYTGRTGRRRWHFSLAPVALALLVSAIVWTERLVARRTFPEDLMSVHLVFAKAGALLLLPVLVSGVVLVRRPAWRRAHRTCVVLFALAAVTAAGTGFWAFLQSVPR